MTKPLAFSFAILSCLLLCACGQQTVANNSGDYASMAVMTSTIPIRIFATAPAVVSGGTVQFIASGGNNPYAFSVLSGSGSINAETGVFVAGPMAGPVTVAVQDIYGMSSSTTIMVTAAGGVAVSVPKQGDVAVIARVRGGQFGRQVGGKFTRNSSRDNAQGV